MLNFSLVLWNYTAKYQLKKIKSYLSIWIAVCVGCKIKKHSTKEAKSMGKITWHSILIKATPITHKVFYVLCRFYFGLCPIKAVLISILQIQKISKEDYLHIISKRAERQLYRITILGLRKRQITYSLPSANIHLYHLLQKAGLHTLSSSVLGQQGNAKCRNSFQTFSRACSRSFFHLTSQSHSFVYQPFLLFRTITESHRLPSHLFQDLLLTWLRLWPSWSRQISNSWDTRISPSALHLKCVQQRWPMLQALKCHKADLIG